QGGRVFAGIDVLGKRLIEDPARVGNLVHAAEWDHAFDGREVEALGFEVFIVGGKQGGEMTARGMTANEEVLGVAVILADVPVEPAKGAGHVLDMFRMLNDGR